MALDRILHGGDAPRTVAEVLAPSPLDPRCRGCLAHRIPAYCDVYDGLPLKGASDCHAYRPILWDEAPGEGRAGSS